MLSQGRSLSDGSGQPEITFNTFHHTALFQTPSVQNERQTGEKRPDVVEEDYVHRRAKKEEMRESQHWVQMCPEAKDGS